MRLGLGIGRAPCRPPQQQAPNTAEVSFGGEVLTFNGEPVTFNGG